MPTRPETRGCEDVAGALLSSLADVTTRLLLTPNARVTERQLTAYSTALDAAAVLLVASDDASVSVDYALRRDGREGLRNDHERARHAISALQRLYGPQASS